MGQKSFKFRLQTILDYKKDLEDQEKEKLAKILAKIEEAIAYKHHLQVTRQNATVELKEKQRAGGIDVNQLRFYTNYLKKLDNDIVQAELEIQKLRAMEKKQREALLEAAKQRQVYEKLKEKHKEEFDEEQAEIERKLIDELATIKFARKIMQENQEKEEQEEAGF